MNMNNFIKFHADLKKGNKKHESLRDAARIESGIKKMLVAGNFKGFTDTFEDLHGLKQLPGIAAQRLMQDGYGFAGEGDWKTAALVRAMKTMATGWREEIRLWKIILIIWNPEMKWYWVHICLKFVLLFQKKNHPVKFTHSVLVEKQIR